MISSILIVVYQIYFIASWWSWWFGGSFGHRAFIETFPFFAIPMAALFATLPNWRWRTPVIVVCSLLIFLCMVEMLQYWKRITPYDLMNWEIFKASFMQIMRYSR